MPKYVMILVTLSALKHQGNTAICVDVEAVTNRLQCCVRFGHPTGFKLSTSCTWGLRINCSAIKAANLSNCICFVKYSTRDWPT